MKPSTSTNLFGIVVLSLLMIFAVSIDANAQGRGRRSSHWDKKCSKFVNCHDARDGRWDGNGPRRSRSRFTNVFRRNRRDRDFDRDRFERRRRNRDRDWGHNRDWRRRR
jgi:hypothetical protein